MAAATAKDESNIIVTALMRQNVVAKVVDCDHYRIHGGMAVETDYIVEVSTKQLGDDDDASFESFKMTKTYSAFRTMSEHLKTAAEARAARLDSEQSKLVQFAYSIQNLIDSQRTEYLGKVNYNYVKSLAKQRTQILNDTLETIMKNFPQELNAGNRGVARVIETFFLTDHCIDIDQSGDFDPSSNMKRRFTNHKKKVVKSDKPIKPLDASNSSISDETEGTRKSIIENDEDVVLISSPPVVPLTRKSRRSLLIRTRDDEMLKEVGEDANLLLDDDRTQPKMVPSYTNPVPTVQFVSQSKLANTVENPLFFLGVVVALVLYLKFASYVRINVDMDVALLILFSSFCVGLHMPRPSQKGIETPVVTPQTRPSPPKMTRAASFVLKKSFVRPSPVSTATPTIPEREEPVLENFSEVQEGTEDPLIISPMQMFPKGAELGSHLNCWSEPEYDGFKVRGKNYLTDKRKIPSGEYLLPARGVDLFLTDACPEHIGTNSGIMGGAFREKPTFIVNFRLPWGVLLFHFEIPEKFLPFLRARYEITDEALPSLDSMTPANRTLCRWLMGDDSHKNKTLKIVPVVIKGPWVVKSVVGGKPAIIGNKLPVTYIYQPSEGDKAMYLEADMDVVASSAARGILSVVRSYTQGLTLDLGFVIQGDYEDELPEQMLGGVRCHGLDPLNASPLPPMKNIFPNFREDESNSTLA